MSRVKVNSDVSDIMLTAAENINSSDMYKVAIITGLCDISRSLAVIADSVTVYNKSDEKKEKADEKKEKVNEETQKTTIFGTPVDTDAELTFDELFDFLFPD